MLTAEERALWEAVVKEAKPLRRGKPRPAEPVPPEATDDAPAPVTETAAKAKAKADREALGALPASLPVPPSSVALPRLPMARPSAPLPGLEDGGTAGIDRRTADRFRRGRLEIDGRLDLHGMTQDQAHDALTRFIRHGAAQGRRFVLVITGKGERGEGVLRQAVPRWLDDAALRPLILAVTRAQPRHGGQGAYYVLLRRRRE
jgi:DNA-nicking Smr family endonuclease